MDEFDFDSPPTATIEMLEHCLMSYIEFGNCYYQQVKGAPMDSPIFGPIAEAILRKLERMVFAVITPKFWIRCVGDTFVIIKEDQVSAFHHLLNNTLPRIHFTI